MHSPLCYRRKFTVRIILDLRIHKFALNSKGPWLIYLVLAFFATPEQWQCFIPFRSKVKIGPQNSLFQSSTAYLFLTLILTLNCFVLLNIVNPWAAQNWNGCSVCLLSVGPRWPCPMRYVAVMLCSWAAHIQFSYFWSVQKYWVNSWTAQITEVDTKPLHTTLPLCDGFGDKTFPF